MFRKTWANVTVNSSRFPLFRSPTFTPPSQRDDALRYIARARKLYEQLGDADGVAQADAFRDWILQSD